MKVKIKINPKIASKGCGFCDIEGKQDIFPPRKNGKPVIDQEFTVEATPFVEAKIASQELLLISREEESKTITYEVFLNSDRITEIEVKRGSSEDEIFAVIEKNKKCVESGVMKKEITGYTIEANKIVIAVK
jgi:hypothetical protein